ncbi:MAG TPA: acetylornithine deacetylase [Thermoanaerobaculia bacterium]|jgi:acetylornithine deacetylase|nr:acetylornithine deacetylase [Thermoanaerobaculia bacterium]
MPLLSDRDLLARLVAFDSTSSNSNLPLADFLCEYLERPGVRIHRDAPADQPKTNLVVEMGPPTDASTRRGLVLSGHMDVVPAGDGWTTPPFELHERNGAFFARGAADMKGFLAVAANLAAAIEPASLQQPLVLVLTYDEELGTLGAAHLHDHWPAGHPLPREAVIGEPTELQPVRVHKGHLKARFTLHGISAHSAYPHLGRNAIEPAGRLIVALAELGRELQRERLPSSASFRESPGPSLNVARVEGGTAINVVPDRCIVDVGVRLLPGMDAAAVAARLQETAASSTGADAPDWELLSVSHPMELAADAPLFRELCALVGEPGETAADYATDAGWLQKMGMECALFGPGSIRVAHKPDEHVPIADLAAARRVLERLIAGRCRDERVAAGRHA